jgi:hypothetical protein
MSVIGTTLKQPRVFAHDAVALKDLPGCVYAGVKGIDLLTSPTTSGTGFEVITTNGQTYQTINPEGTGSGAVICVTEVGPNGEIVSAQICEGYCSNGSSYSVGDVLTVIWEESSTYSSGTNADNLVQVDDLAFSPWDYGCPFSPMENRLTEDEIDKLNYILPVDNSLKAFKQKDIVKWNCETGEPGFSSGYCDWATFNPGAALYIGAAMTSITVIMESGNKVTYENIPAGTFMPVLCLTVCAAVAETEGVDPKEVILALF